MLPLNATPPSGLALGRDPWRLFDLDADLEPESSNSREPSKAKRRLPALFRSTSSMVGLTAVLVSGAVIAPFGPFSQDNQTTTSADTVLAADRSPVLRASRDSREGIALASQPVVSTTSTTAAPEKTTTTVKPTTTTAKPKPTTTAPKPVVTPSNCSGSRAAAEACWGDLIRQYPWNYQTAFNIMWCESRGNPNARNPRSTATGLFQILNGPTDPKANVALAYSMYSKRGWQPWVCKG